MSFEIDSLGCDESGEQFRQALKILKDEFSPTQTYLFGSRAHGESTHQSDYDLLLVIEGSSMSGLERMQRAHSLLWRAKIRIPIDIFIYTKEEFERQKGDINSLPEIVMSEGE